MTNNITYDFAGRTVVVTGGTRGIGAAVSRAFLVSGARVFAVYGVCEASARTFSESLDETVRQRFHAEKMDVADGAAVEAFFRTFTESGLDILVNNAGLRRDAALALMSAADWRRVLDVNLDGAYHCCKAAVQIMSPRRYGRIINIVSPSGREGFAGQSNYAASKAGLSALTRCLSKETARRNITVNAVSPGFIDTELIADLAPELAARYRDSVPVKRFGASEEVAGAVLFLAAWESSYITGATVDVTGGL